MDQMIRKSNTEILILHGLKQTVFVVIAVIVVTDFFVVAAVVIVVIVVDLDFEVAFSDEAIDDVHSQYNWWETRFRTKKTNVFKCFMIQPC